MNNYSLVEEYFLKVDALFGEGDYAAGKQLLEEILQMEPDYGRAHNHLGWLYYAKFDDFKKAGYHMRLAMKFTPAYPAGWMNYCYLLNELNEAAELKTHALQALKVKGINRALVHNELGRSAEMNGELHSAIEHYREALRSAMHKHESEAFTENLSRVEKKIESFQPAKRRSLFSL